MERMNIEIKPSLVSLLKKFLSNTSSFDNIIREYYEKKNCKLFSTKNQYKEGSTNWLNAVEKEEKSLSLPDHNIVDAGNLTISHGYNNKISFTIMKYTCQEKSWDDDYGQEYEYIAEKYFLVNNSCYGDNFISCFTDLLLNIDYQHLLVMEQMDNLKEECSKELEFIGEGYHLLLDIVFKARKELKSVDYYTKYNKYNKCVVIDGKDIYDETELALVYNDYTKHTRFYDESDRKIEYYGCGNNTYFEYHRKNRPIEEVILSQEDLKNECDLNGLESTLGQAE